METSNCKFERLNNLLFQGEALGLDLSELRLKLEEVVKNNNGIIRIVLLGSFSDGKTSAIAGLLGRLDTAMKIDIAESSDELSVYHLDGLKDGYEIVDTPGLFGTKEKEVDGKQIKYSEITEKYISEAHLVIYVCDAVVPLKDSHVDSLRLVLRDFNKLAATIFVVNKMDEAGVDMLDDEEYNEAVQIKKNNLLERLRTRIQLTPQEEKDLKIVCISADPKGKGLKFWFERMDEYKKRSHIELLRNSMDSIISANNKDDLESFANMAVIKDVLMSLSKNISIAVEATTSPIEQCKRQLDDMKTDCNILKQELNRSRRSMTEQLDEVKKSILADLKNASTMPSIASVVEDDLGIEDDKVSCYILLRKINQILSECAETNKLNLEKKAIEFECKFKKQEAMIIEAISFSNRYLKNVNVNKDIVFKMRDTFFKGYKFKPWGAGKWAVKATKWLGRLSIAISVLTEIWSWYKGWETRNKIEENKNEIKNAINDLFQEIFSYFDNDEKYYENFAPSYPEMCKQVEMKIEELNKLSLQNTQLIEYKTKISNWFRSDIEDAEYEEMYDNSWDNCSH
jgi:hypothetical protein